MASPVVLYLQTLSEKSSGLARNHALSTAGYEFSGNFRWFVYEVAGAKHASRLTTRLTGADFKRD